ncbi:MAG: YvcK family protein [Firmicutes bacterium]|nr:YvcK family protein [Bacillota bacterium]
MKSNSLRYGHAWVPYALAAGFLVIIGLLLLAMRYGVFPRVQLSLGGFGTFMIWLSMLALLAIAMWLLFYARDVYLRQRRLARRRASQRARVKSAADSGLYITAIGGGTGLSTILRGLKEISSHINAVVTVTDDGGSSGRLLEGNTTVPPGDIRNCLVALSPREGIMESMFNYRFENPEELRGHSLGNLMIAGLSDLTGDTATAIRDIGRILNIRGNVIPVTLDDVTLGAEMSDGDVVMGETALVHDSRSIRQVFLSPRNAIVNADAVDAIINADVVLLGPGSLYTSVIPNLLVPGIVDALTQTTAPVWYVANIMTQRGETEGYDLSDHIEAIMALAPRPFLTGVIVNTKRIEGMPVGAFRKGGLSQVKNDVVAIKKYGLRVVGLPLAKDGDSMKHDASVLADFIASGRF